MDFFKHIPTPIIIILVSLLSVSAVISTFPVISFLKAGSVKAFDAIMNVGGFIYGTGTVCKFAFFGPSFIRWHLADFGFAICAISVIYMFLSKGTKTPDESIFERKYNNLITEWMEKVRGNLVRSAIAGFTVCLAYEIFTGYLVGNVPDTKAGIGGFDYIDVLAYLLAAILVLTTVVVQNKVSLRKMQAQ